MRDIARRPAAALMLVVASTALAACADEPAAQRPVAANLPLQSVTSRAPGPIPTVVANVAQLRKNVIITDCGALPGDIGWQASGEAMNPTTRPVDYTITVFFTNRNAADIDYGVTHVSVAPSETAHWNVSTQLPSPSHLRCVLRGVG